MSLPTRYELAQQLRQSFIGEGSDSPYNWEWLTPAQRRSWLEVADKAIASGAKVRPEPKPASDGAALAALRSAVKRAHADCPNVASILDHFNDSAEAVGYDGDPRPEDEILYDLISRLDDAVTNLALDLQRAQDQARPNKIVSYPSLQV